jgi:hypothetical protein
MSARCLLLALTLAMAACGGGQPCSEMQASLASQIEALERSGQLPRLERSSDIRGPDANNNGIRDDIDAWIAAQPVTDQQRKALQQAARVLQRELLVDLADKAAHDVLGAQTSAYVDCLHDSFAPDSVTASAYGARIEAITANTRERAKRYLAYNRAVSGSSGTIPRGDNCEP